MFVFFSSLNSRSNEPSSASFCFFFGGVGFLLFLKTIFYRYFFRIRKLSLIFYFGTQLEGTHIYGRSKRREESDRSRDRVGGGGHNVEISAFRGDDDERVVYAMHDQHGRSVVVVV